MAVKTCTVSLKDRLLLATALVEGRIAANLASISKSGLTRKIKFVAVLVRPEEGTTTFLRVTHLIAAIAGYEYDRDDLTLTVKGCGFDAIYDVVDNLIYQLGQDGELLAELSLVWKCNTEEATTRLEKAKRSLFCL